MKIIRIHGLAPDNSGQYHEAGTVLTVADDPAAGCIDHDRAKQLLDIGSATDASPPVKVGKTVAED